MGASQSPGCSEGTEGGKGMMCPSREGGSLGINFPKFGKSPPPSLPASPCLLPPARSQWAVGQRAVERGEWGLHLLLGLKAWMLGGGETRGEGPVTGVVAPCPPHLPKPPPTPRHSLPLAQSVHGYHWECHHPTLLPGLETLLVPTGCTPSCPTHPLCDTMRGCLERNHLLSCFHPCPQVLQL